MHIIRYIECLEQTGPEFDYECERFDCYIRYNEVSGVLYLEYVFPRELFMDGITITWLRFIPEAGSQDFIPGRKCLL